MHNVLFSIVYIKRGEGAKALYDLYPSMYAHMYTYIHLIIYIER